MQGMQSSQHLGSNVVITIDGPAGTGKSTVAHDLATRLGLDFLDTGAMYRAAALLALESDIDPTNGSALATKVHEVGIKFDWNQDPPGILIGDRDVSKRIRDLDVSVIVSIVAAQSQLRAELVSSQLQIAQEHPRLVTEGRDQGSSVFPDAVVRFFLSASLEIRADRRIEQLENSGTQVSRERIIQDISGRDRLDTERADGPLVRPSGAVDIDTDSLSIEQVVDLMESIVRQTTSEAGLKL